MKCKCFKSKNGRFTIGEMYDITPFRNDGVDGYLVGCPLSGIPYCWYMLDDFNRYFTTIEDIRDSKIREVLGEV